MLRSEDYKREIAIIFFAHQKVIWTITLAIFVCSVLIAFFWPPTYLATGSILIKGKKPETKTEGLEKEAPRFFELTKEDLYSEMQILTSPDVIGNTIRHLDTNGLVFEGKGFIKFPYKKEEEAATFNDRINKVKKHLETSLLPASNVIGVSYRSKNPTYAETLLGALMDQYVIYRTQIYSPSEEKDFLAEQTKNFKENLNAKEEELIALVKETRSADPQKEIDSNLAIKNDLERLQQQLKNDVIEKKLFIEHLERTIASKDIEFFSFIENNMPLSGLGMSLQGVYSKWRDVLKNYRPEAENARALEKEVDEMSQALKKEVETYKSNQENQYRIMLKKIANIECEIEKITERNTQLRIQLLASQKITRDIDFLRLSHDTLARRKEEVRMQQDLNPATRYISILSKAFRSSGPVFPQPVKVIPMGILVGFILGCSAAFLKEYFDHTFKKPRDVEVYADLPVLFSIPLLK